MRFIKISKFCELTGYTAEAIQVKIRRGIWMENREYRRAPDNVILVDVEGYEQWARGERAAA